MATSNLQRETSEYLAIHLDSLVIENTRPDWLICSQGERLELDFYIPGLDVVIEVQGIQHYEFTRFFHKDLIGFNEQKRRDTEKRSICEKKGITVFEINSSHDVRGVTMEIIALIPEAETDEEFLGRMKDYNNSMPRLNILKSERKRFFRLIKKWSKFGDELSQCQEDIKTAHHNSKGRIQRRINFLTQTFSSLDKKLNKIIKRTRRN